MLLQIKICLHQPVYLSIQENLQKNVGNVCKLQQPCQNGGFCQPIKRRRYKCQCTGTGFYGTNCETVCPEPNPMDTQFWRFPQDCIFI
uniref:EGF-like domain-containing protein n=1 Tax=Ciona savignyi TaxID=51511 RepID=H2ZJJ5_CIOSA